MATTIFGPQVTALLAALFAVGSSVLAFRALETRKWALFAVSGTSCALLIYLAIMTLPLLTR
jgi:hypothetical protein